MYNRVKYSKGLLMIENSYKLDKNSLIIIIKMNIVFTMYNKNEKKLHRSLFEPRYRR
jgi:hypothetical protein